MPGCGPSTEIASIAVTPANPSVAKGHQQQFVATATYTDNSQSVVTNQVTWTSSNTSVATVGGSGLASTLATGTTTIRATDPATSVYGETTLTVTPAVLDSIAVTPPDATILTGGTQQFTATGTYSDSSSQDLTSSASWSSSNTSVATINSSGLATGVAQGTSTITATDTGSGVFGSTSLTVKDATPPPDTTPPNVWNVNTILREGGHIGSVSVTVSWSAGDNVTPTDQLVFEIQRRRFRMHGPTAWQAVATVTGETSLYQIPLWHRYQYQVRARDQAGNWSTWAQGPQVTFVRRDERSFVRDASWTIVQVPGAMRGSVARSSTPGGTASLTFTGNGVALVATTGAGQGTVQVCIDPGTAAQSCRTVDLSTLPAGTKQLPLVFTLPWATHSMQVSVVSGSVDLDGAVFSR